MKTITTNPAPSGRALIKVRTSLPMSLVKKASAAARKEGMDLDSFIARSIEREPNLQPALMLDADESRRLALLADKMRTSPARVLHAAVRNLLGYGFALGSRQHRVIDLANDLADAMGAT